MNLRFRDCGHCRDVAAITNSSRSMCLSPVIVMGEMVMSALLAAVAFRFCLVAQSL